MWRVLTFRCISHRRAARLGCHRDDALLRTSVCFLDYQASSNHIPCCIACESNVDVVPDGQVKECKRVGGVENFFLRSRQWRCNNCPGSPGMLLHRCCSTESSTRLTAAESSEPCSTC